MYINCSNPGGFYPQPPRNDSIPHGEDVSRNTSQYAFSPLCAVDRSPAHQFISDVQFWANIYSVKITSDECLTKVQSLLTRRSNMNVARSFQGNEAQTFIDFLDRVSKPHRGVPRASAT